MSRWSESGTDPRQTLLTHCRGAEILQLVRRRSPAMKPGRKDGSRVTRVFGNYRGAKSYTTDDFTPNPLEFHIYCLVLLIIFLD